jgi:hypothetical protein
MDPDSPRFEMLAGLLGVLALWSVAIALVLS